MCHLILPRIDKPHLDHTRVQDIISCHESAIRHRGATPEAPLAQARRPLKASGGGAAQQGPQAVDLDRPPARIAALSVQTPVSTVDGGDAAVPEVADQQVTGELAEAGRCDLQPLGDT
jgi:hypothetical protein